MANHEKRCTMNPNRECRVCEYAKGDDTRTDLAAAISMLPRGDWEKARPLVPALREATGNCPACILAALRQANIPCSSVDYDYKDEMRSLWSSVNDATAEAAHY